MNDLLVLSPLILPPVLAYFLGKHLYKIGKPIFRVVIYSIFSAVFLFLFLVLFVTPDKRDDVNKINENKMPESHFSDKTKSKNVASVSKNEKIKSYEGKLYETIGKPVSAVSALVGKPSNSVSNIVFDENEMSFLYEAYQNKVSYVEVEFKDKPCNQQDAFDSEPLLVKLGIAPEKIQLARKRTHFHTYYDHHNKLKIGVSCPYDGGSLTVGFSKRYYMQ